MKAVWIVVTLIIANAWFLLYPLLTTCVAEVNNSKQQAAHDIKPVSSSCNYDFSLGYADLVQDVLPAVVNIASTSTREINASPLEQFFGMGIFPFDSGRMPKKIKKKATSLGSGFFIDNQGNIVTNYHVIKDATEIHIKTNSGKEYKATIVGFDEVSDLAVIKANVKSVEKFIKFGSSEKVRIGDKVLAIGNPFGLGGTVTSGIISAKSRSIGHSAYDDFLQTDAAINQGNSGGPMFNLCGEAIGINTAIFSTSGGSMGIGFAIASDSAINVITKLKNKEKITRAWLGVEIQPVTSEMVEALNLKEKRGVYVNQVVPDSPAAKGGIKSGDVIMSVDDKELGTEASALPNYIASKKPDTNVVVTIIRGEKTQKLTIKLASLKPEQSEHPAAKMPYSKTFGLSVENLTKEKRLLLRVPSNIDGVVIMEVKNETILEFGAIQEGDILTHVNEHVVKNSQELAAIAKKISAANKKHVVFKIYRNGSQISIAMPIR